MKPGKKTTLPQIPLSKLSEQQKKIYKLSRDNLSTTDIARRLNIDPRNVSMQKSRIRKKAEKLQYTYKINPGAEHAQNTIISPSEELKKKLKEDPGLISLIYRRYGTEDNASKENDAKLTASGGDPCKLIKARSKHFKVLSTGASKPKNRLLLKLTKEQRNTLKHYLKTNNIKPIEVDWCDNSAFYNIGIKHFFEIQKEINNKKGDCNE